MGVLVGGVLLVIVVGPVIARYWAVVVGIVAVAVFAAVALRLVRAGRQESEAEKARLASVAKAARMMTVAELYALSPTAFERHIASLCVRDGLTVIQAGGGARDRGADVIATLPDGRRVVIQCKRYKPDRYVPSGDIQTFVGMAFMEHKADVAVFVTTTQRISGEARTIAASHGIILIRGDELGFWAKDMSILRFLPPTSQSAAS